MPFQNPDYYKKLKPYKFDLCWGTFCFAERVVLGKFYESAYFYWQKAETLIAKAIDFYRYNKKFVSNKIFAKRANITCSTSIKKVSCLNKAKRLDIETKRF